MFIQLVLKINFYSTFISNLNKNLRYFPSNVQFGFPASTFIINSFINSRTGTFSGTAWQAFFCTRSFKFFFFHFYVKFREWFSKTKSDLRL